VQDTKAKTLMVVGAHHDDNELNAGTIARHVEAGWRVVSVVMTNGRFSRDEVDDATIDVRNGESRAAASLLGGEPPVGHSPKLYYCDGWFVPFDPDVYVDVTGYFDIKTKALACHASQLPAMAGERSPYIVRRD
jgi:LmbE family N-acetylglucosaminyl deacetylase